MTAPSNQPGTLPAPRRVLVVDDDDDIREVTAMVLEGAGYAVESVKNGREALALLRRVGPVDVILLDLMMPDADGWWFRAEAAQDQALAGIPTVILSGAGKVEEAAAALGVEGFLIKPIDLAQLLAVVGHHCR